jgi:hypothetical protein
MDGTGHEMEKLPLRRRHRDVRQDGAVRQRGIEDGVIVLQQARRVRVDGFPAIVAHGPAV